ncbi:DUF1983 domain-containing protein [Shinella sp.]|uniref:phage tail tip fiber protein n=1 Tax=Shinella sp. TaxID=1870904 RepID=UPI0028A91C37|nr:DUF1983 domain-containing protein [Shinella sp.]
MLDRFKDLQQGLDDTRPLLEQILTNQQLHGAVSESARRRLSVEVGRNRAAFDEQIVVVANELEALAEQITDVSAEVDENFAQGRVRFTAAANQTGALARFAVQMRVNDGGAWFDAGFFLEIVNSGGTVKSQFVVVADRFIVTDPGNINNKFLPLVFEGGVLKLQVANIGTVTAGYLTGPSGKFVVNLTQDYLSVDD